MSDHPERLVFAPDVVLQVIDGEALILKLNEEVVFSLNATGARIAQLIADGHSIDAIIHRIADEYGTTPNTLSSDVLELVEMLRAKGLVVRDLR